MKRPSQQRAAKGEPEIRVLIVEDIATIAATMQSALQQAGMTTELAVSGAEALALKDAFAPMIALVDLGLPDMDGLDLVAQFAAAEDCGIIVVTADGAEATRVRGLDIGADDYIVKPLALPELVARVRALHRRLQRPGSAAPGQITVDSAARTLVGGDGKRSPLTDAEFVALTTLLEAGGASVSREWLARTALRRVLHADDRSVDQLVLKLRRKLSEHGASPRTILSVRGQGYVIADPTVFGVGSEG